MNKRKTRSDQRKHHIIYKTTCTITRKYYYGMHSTDDLDDGYLGSGKRLRYSINKYGVENHVREVVEMLPDRKTLITKEREVIDETMVKDEMCMNLACGGVTCVDPEKISRSLKGRPVSKETRARISQTLKGRIISDEARQKMSVTWKQKRATMEYSDKTRQKLSKNAKKKWKEGKLTGWPTGQRHTEEARRKITENLLGRPLSDGEWVQRVIHKNRQIPTRSEASTAYMQRPGVREALAKQHRGRIHVYNPSTGERKKIFPEDVPVGFIRGLPRGNKLTLGSTQKNP